MNGGYALIDCTGLELTSQSEQTVNGVYEAIEAAYKYNKPIYVVNCEWEDDRMTPISVFVTKRASGNFIATSSTLQLEVTNQDKITITNMIS